MKAMILAAGLGTRLKPFTENHPKALAIVNDKPLLQRNIEYLKSFGIREFVINVHHFADQILNFLKANNNFGCQIEISDETSQLLETGGGIKKASSFLKDADSFILMNVDILTNMDLSKAIDFHRKNNSLATLAISSRTSSRQLLFDSNYTLSGWRNLKTNEEIIKRDLSELKPFAFSGIHIINTSIFPLIKKEGKFSIIDTYLDLCKDHKIHGYEHVNDVLIDVGTMESVEKAERVFN